ncbi:hypothetical protein EYF80_043786 [Liparis tanakae]|uniref:Uncharacterized protein n=1 Tax=Liparis tanakae TaxID=230148 RepID=A0A4Z2FXK2_9TELE|nr:hypothetical protein EYF80_043786 [Liparis tanakae]
MKTGNGALPQRHDHPLASGDAVAAVADIASVADVASVASVAAVLSLILSGERVGVAPLSGRLSVELGGSGEDALEGLALKVAHAAHRAVVLADEVVEYDAGPLARGELRLPEVGDGAELDPVDPDLLAHGVVAQDVVALFGDSRRRVWRTEEETTAASRASAAA